MSNYTITPLRTGTIIVDKGQYVTRGIDSGVHVPIPATAWYLTDGTHRVLVDTGMCETGLAEWHHAGSCQQQGEAIHEQLVARGIDPSTIDVVILTHLHWDHCHNLDKFPEARLVVSAAEHAWANAPHPLYFRSYEYRAPGGITPPFAGRTFDLVTGETTVLPGIDVFPTLGHTPGHQSVAVQTTGGIHVVTGDACFGYVNLQPASAALRFTIMGRVMDLLAAWRSLEIITERADVVLPAHDDLVFQHASYPA